MQKNRNHWNQSLVYLPGSQIFTGVELKDAGGEFGTLERLEVSLERYARYLHVGPYSAVGAIWPQFISALKQRGEVLQYPNVEIYGHWDADEAKCETTLLIGLA